MQRAIAGVHKFIGNAKLDAARRLIRDAYFRLPIGEVIARAERLNAASREANARGERERKRETRDQARIQDEAILPTAGVQVKTTWGDWAMPLRFYFGPDCGRRLALPKLHQIVHRGECSRRHAVDVEHAGQVIDFVL